MSDVPNSDGTWPLAVIDGRPSVPCLGCGHCCMTGPCMSAYSAFPGRAWTPDTWACPALRHDGERYRCGLVEDAKGEKKKHLLTMLYIGAGCCASLNDRRRRLARRFHELRSR